MQFFGRWPSWHTFVVSETHRYCVFCVSPLAKLAMLMNMAEYGFSFRHKLSLCHLYHLQVYLDSRLHSIIVPSLDSFITFFYQPCSLNMLHLLDIYIHWSFASSMSMTSNLNIHVPNQNHPNLYCHIYHQTIRPFAFSKAPNSTEAARRYRRLVQPSASADSTASHKDVRKGNLSEIQVPLLKDVEQKMWWGVWNHPVMSLWSEWI